MKTMIISMLSVATFALPLNINTSGKGDSTIDKVVAKASYKPVISSCDSLEEELKVEIKDAGKAVVDLKRSTLGKCGVYKLERATLKLTIAGNEPFTAEVLPGSMTGLNDYAHGRWAKVYWGSKITGSCLFRDGKQIMCNVHGSDNTSRHSRTENFKLFVSPMYVNMNWNITVVDGKCTNSTCIEE